MQDLLGKLITYAKKAFPPNDFLYVSDFKRGCGIHIIYSKRLKQVIVLKSPNRKHYISPKMADEYLKNSLKTVEDVLGKDEFKNTYILNVLISRKLTKQCHKLVRPGNNEQMVMVFNPKLTDEGEIFRTITRALSTKFRKWANSIKKSCNKPHKVYHETSKGMIRKDVRIEPYGDVKKRISEIEKAADIFEVASLRGFGKVIK